VTSPFKVPDETLEKQERVSDPSVSAWVSANAGAGKTTVLVRRVIRLLLAGNAPARILCLTFTKAAAANMANKVLETLSRWVRLDDAALDDAIRAVSPLPPTPALRAKARRLFAQALETPGGLKVQTIHAFCDRVLHQFPMEAGVQAGFEVLDDVQEADLLLRAREAVLIEASNRSESTLGRALETAVAAASDDSFASALDEAVRGRRKVVRLQDIGGRSAIAAALGLSPDDSEAAAAKEILDGNALPRREWPAIVAALSPLAGNAASCAKRFQLAIDTRNDIDAVEEYLCVFFNDEGEPRADGQFGAQKARDSEPKLYARLLAERARLVPLRARFYAARALERTSALLTLAAATIERFESAKRDRGALDYSDLIEKTADMLADTGSAWVLYKLDGGIDHVLIDEAQDTSPEQWHVIERLTEEFFAGSGARASQERTVFVVGDDKQSIFSFQGADPRLFGEKRDVFGQRVKQSGQTFHPVDLLLSFRSARGILQAVDAVFGREPAHRGLSSCGERGTIHEAIRQNAPALVELWDVEEPDDDEDEGLAWDAPLDARGEASPTVRLAQRIARAVKHWIDGGLAIEDRKIQTLRAPRAGDVIVLVRRRGPLFEAVLQALKKAGVPVAGADRLKLPEHIAVMDLMALGDALLLEADDLSLACALKSPLLGLNEDDLYALAQGRQGTLAASLASHTSGNARITAASDAITRWRKEAAALRPFDLYSRVLGRDKGRERMLSRLGHEAADAIDEFLAGALAYERAETPSLAGFLHFLRRAGTEVKRDLEVESNAVRVMTVHGAKGLEAPLVILADTTSIPDGRHERLLDLPGSEAFVWAGRKDADSPPEQTARQAADELRKAEYRRLLYVALTRAADALVICGARGKNQIQDGCWYKLVRDALEADEPPLLERTSVQYADGGVLRWRPAPMAAVARQPDALTPVRDAAPWLHEAAPPSPPAPLRLAPSSFDEDEEPLSHYARASAEIDPRRRGDLLHRLLHHLPEQEKGSRHQSAQSFLVSMAPEISAAGHGALIEEAMRIVEHPQLAELFGPESRAEVDLLAHLGRDAPHEISGRIDRLAVSKEYVTVADFKTGRAPDESEPVPGNYLRQLAVYREVLRRIYPNRAMRCMLVWTESAAIREIPAETLDAASSAVFTAT
jgi:ATP-dependent helicase/nuclease subunit A